MALQSHHSVILKMNQKYRNLTFFILLAILFVTSCKAPVPLEEINYMYGIETDQTYEDGPVPDEYKIRPNDQLYIKVISDDPLNAAFLNLTGAQTVNFQFRRRDGINYLSGG